MKHLAEGIVVISGAGAGIGRALAQEFARHGARLSLFDINLKAVNATATALAEAGVSVIAQRVDASVSVLTGRPATRKPA